MSNKGVSNVKVSAAYALLGFLAVAFAIGTSVGIYHSEGTPTGWVAIGLLWGVMLGSMAVAGLTLWATKIISERRR